MASVTWTFELICYLYNLDNGMYFSFTKVSFCVLLWLVISAYQYRFPVQLWPGSAVRVSADSVTGSERGREMLPEMLQWGVSHHSFCPHSDMLGLLAFLLLSDHSTFFLDVQHIVVCVYLWLAFIYIHDISLHIINVHIVKIIEKQPNKNPSVI